MKFNCPYCNALFDDMCKYWLSIDVICPNCNTKFSPSDKNLNTSFKIKEDLIGMIRVHDELSFLLYYLPDTEEKINNEYGFEGCDSDKYRIIENSNDQILLSDFLSILSLAGDWKFTAELLEKKSGLIYEQALLFCSEIICTRIIKYHYGSFYDVISVILQKLDNPIIYNKIVNIIEEYSDGYIEGTRHVIECTLYLIKENLNKIIRFPKEKSIVDVLKNNLHTELINNNPYSTEYALYIIENW